jgi:hypothetical protein
MRCESPSRSGCIRTWPAFWPLDESDTVEKAKLKDEIDWANHWHCVLCNRISPFREHQNAPDTAGFPGHCSHTDYKMEVLRTAGMNPDALSLHIEHFATREES